MKLFVPFDGSCASQNAVKLLCAHHTDFHDLESIVLVNVVEPLANDVTEEMMSDGQSFGDITQEKLEAYYRFKSDEVFEVAQTLLDKEGLSYRKIYEVGDARRQLLKQIELEKPDLIVMGSRGKTVFETLLLGSVLTGLVAETSVPVLMVGECYQPTVHDKVKIGVAVDSLTVMTKPLEYVLNHQNAFSSQVSYQLIHVSNRESFGVETLPKAMIDELLAGHETTLEMTGVCLQGEIGMALTENAEKAELGLMVMGSHGYGRIRSAVMGSIVRRVASLSKIPLLIVR